MNKYLEQDDINFLKILGVVTVTGIAAFLLVI